jgi:hypothetical protein
MPRKDPVPRHLPKHTTDGHPIKWVRTSTVRQYCDPYQGCWPDLAKPISVKEVEQCLRAGAEKEHAPFRDWFANHRDDAAVNRQMHVEKIAWFARYGFQQPLEVDVGIPSMGCYVDWFVQDGNHRLAAAIFRQEHLGENPWLPLSVGGSVNYAKDLGLW